MKKRMTRGVFIFFMFSIFFINLIPSVPEGLNGGTLSAAESPGILRIGLEAYAREKDSIAIGNNAIALGFLNGEAFDVMGNFTSPAGFSIVPSPSTYVLLQQGLSLPEAQSLAMAGGLSAPIFPGVTDNKTWGVYAGGFASQEDAKALAAAYGGTVLPASAKRMALMKEGGVAALIDLTNSYPVIISADGSYNKIGDRYYRGRIEFGRYENNKVTAVNLVTVNEYLYGVVPSEMPASWHMEALKAQSCAARTYALAHKDSHKSRGYDLCDIVHCQAYAGAGNEAASTTKAVDDTAGVAIYYNNKLIDAVFFSSSGGATDNSENAWSYQVPYLRGVKEMNETTGRVWNKAYTMDEITSLLNSSGANIGKALQVSISGSTPDGWVTELTIQGSSGSKAIAKEAIRTFFSGAAAGALDSRKFSISSNSFPSPAITENSYPYAVSASGTSQIGLTAAYAQSAGGKQLMESLTRVYIYTKEGNINISQPQSPAATTTGKTANGNTVYFSGRGWGHGIGMSQHGANGMAALGYTFDQILKYYYTGVEVK